jgi:acyl-CoA synthetase (AMP-forming)/AMP-acid ligase II
MMVDSDVLQMLPDDVCPGAELRCWESIEDLGRVEPSPPEIDDIAFIQFSSGSTRTPKGCMLTARAIEAQLWLIVEMLKARAGAETIVSWLPLSHDMGIFGALLAPWIADEDLILSSPQRFMLSPRTWFKDVADSGATITVGTNTALALAARVQRRSRLSRRLSLHTVILGAERNEWDTLGRALETFGPCGLEEQALMPAYGLAEATLAVTRTPREQAPRHLVVDGVALAEGNVREVELGAPSATRIVSAGVPCSGVALGGLEQGRLNELRVHSPSLARGYFGDDGLTRSAFVDGGVMTGDLAFLHGGHLFPVGRVDDVISIGGRKIHACEIEAAIDELKGVRRGCATVVDTSASGVQQLTLLAELREGVASAEHLANAAAALAMGKAAVTLNRCVFLSKGALPKTPSGKIQRYRCREMLAQARFEPLQTVDLT